MILSKYQYKFIGGYSIFVSKMHKYELHELDYGINMGLMEEMNNMAAAVNTAFEPDKLNYELLGNTVRHMNWYIFPRYKSYPNVTSSHP